MTTTFQHYKIYMWSLKKYEFIDRIHKDKNFFVLILRKELEGQ